jgi:hypothetical protein
MKLSEYLERWGSAIFEGPFASREDEPPELAEIRFAILDFVREKTYRSGGKRVFPSNTIHILVRGVEASRASVFTGRFFKSYLERVVRSNLEKAECRFPEDLKLEVAVTRDMPRPDQPWLSIEAETSDRNAPRSRRVASLVVLEGSANITELPIQKTRTNIGRTVDVYRSEGLFRRNDLAFAEDTEINRTVSREHAHIVFDKAGGEYRLFNDRWYRREDATASCGIWLVRDGMSQEIHRTARGTRLLPGDEIHLGRAVVRFQLKS